MAPFPGRGVADVTEEVDQLSADAAARPRPSGRGAVARGGGRSGGLRLDAGASAAAVLFFCLSLTPSLLPRHWFLQGAISGVVTAIGYAVGLVGRSLGRWLTGWDPSPRTRRSGRRALAATAAVAVPWFLYRGSSWQGQIHALMGLEEPSRTGYLGVLLVAAALFVAVLGVARLLRAASRRLGHFFDRWVHTTVARVAGAVVVGVVVVALVQGVVARGLMYGANNSFKALNAETDPGVAPPRDATRSGSAESHVPWASLGRQGRALASGGPTTADLRRFSGSEPMAPIRAYVGLDSADSVEERAALAVRELERTGAFSRAVLCVITATGTGWIDRRTIDPLEFMYNGDTALVGIQYSYLPSFLSFVVDRDRARDTGRELFNQVYDRWSELPPAERPKLLVVGKSLGAFGAVSAFSGIDDIRNRTDGVLLVGPPNATPLWREFVARRDRGTPEILPSVDRGETVRFASGESDLAAPGGPWDPPRVVVLQNASDPVVWWSPGLALRQPQWLKETRGDDVLLRMRWYPFVTFWQVSADLVFSLDAPGGHGHNYATEPVAAWTHILPPPGWTPDRTAALRKAVGSRRVLPPEESGRDAADPG